MIPHVNQASAPPPSPAIPFPLLYSQRVVANIVGAASSSGEGWTGIMVLDIYKMKLHSCDIEYFVETNTRKLCVILRSHVLLVCVLIKDIGRRLPLELQCRLYQSQEGGVNQSVRGNYKTRF